MTDEPKITAEFAAKVAACPKCHPGIRGWCFEHGTEFSRQFDGATDRSSTPNDSALA